MRGIMDTNDVFDIAQIEIQLGAATYRLFGMELTRTTLFLIIGGLVVLIAVIFVVIFVFHKKSKNKKRKKQTLEGALPVQQRSDKSADQENSREEEE